MIKKLLFSGMIALALVLTGCFGLFKRSQRLTVPYQLWQVSSREVLIAPRYFSQETPIIPIRVVEVGCDQRWIIARQEVMKPDGKFSEDLGPSFKPGNSAYWILDVSQPRRYGPYSLSEFEKQRQALGVPGEIQLIPVDFSRPKRDDAKPPRAQGTKVGD